MGFIAPALPFIGGLAGSLFGGGKPKRDDSEKAIFGRQSRLADLGIQGLERLFGFADSLNPYAMAGLTQIGDWYPMTTQGIANAEKRGLMGDEFLGQAKSAFTPALDYYTKILAGGPQAMEALSPEIQQANSGFTAAKNQISQFGPSGGGRSAALNALPLQRSAAISNIFSTARPQAAAGLNALGSSAGGLGSALAGQNASLTGSLAGNLTGLSSGLTSDILRSYSSGGAAGAGGLQSMMQNELLRSQIGADRGAGLGTGIFNILKNLPLGEWLGGKG